MTEFIQATGVAALEYQPPVIGGSLKAAIKEGASFTLLTGNLSYTDADSLDTDVTFVVSNVVGGTVQLNGVDTESFTGADLKAGLVSFKHSGDEGTTAGFDVTVSDEANSDADSAHFKFTVTPVNDAPVMTLGETRPTVVEGESYTFVQSDISSYDPDDGTGGITFTVSNLSHGILKVNGVTKNTFTQRDLDSGLVAFIHNGDEAATAGFKIKVEDGNEDRSTPSISTFTLDVEATDDPAKVSGTLKGTVHEIATPTTTGTLKIVDPDSPTTFVAVTDGASDSGYGTFSITAAGVWTYTINPESTDVAALNTGESLTDQLTVQTAGGNLVYLAITVQGTTNIVGTDDSDVGETALVGSTVQDYIYGLAGNDMATGLGGDDFLFGDAGNDKLYGDDVVKASKGGKDVLDGGAGKDLLNGGGGADTFVFDDGDSGVKVAQRDVISDFSHSLRDIIDLSDIDADSKTAKDDAFKIYATEKLAQANAGGLFLSAHGKDLTIYMNTDTDKAYEMSIELTGVTKLVAGDFHL